MKNKIGELKKDKDGFHFRMIDGEKIFQIKEETQKDIDLNSQINLMRLRLKCNHENISREDGLDECLDCGTRNY